MPEYSYSFDGLQGPFHRRLQEPDKRRDADCRWLSLTNHHYLDAKSLEVAQTIQYDVTGICRGMLCSLVFEMRAF